MYTLFSIVLLIQYSICVQLYTYSTLLKYTKAIYNMFSMHGVIGEHIKKRSKTHVPTLQSNSLTLLSVMNLIVFSCISKP